MLWCDVYDAAGTRMGDGPVLLMGATVKRVLDGAGSISIEAPLTDDYAVTQLQSQRRVFIWTDVPQLRLVGAGIITRLSKKMGSGGWTLSADGPDLMYEFKFVNTLLNRQFDAAVAVEVLDTLVNLANGWILQSETDETTGITARFDGSSALKAMQAICEQTGLHFRYVENRVVQAGYFGANSGVTLINPDSSNADSPYTAIIDSLSVLEESEDICNWLIPLGSGEGEAALTLELTSQAFPYLSSPPVKYSITGSEGDTQYYIKDDDSILLYGERRKVVKFDVSPLTNSLTDRILAANQLHVAATEYLDKNSMPQITYGVSVRRLEQRVLPGDKVRLMYLGPIRREDSTVVADERIDEMLFVIAVEERHSADDVTWRFEVSNIDRKLPGEADIVVNEIEQAKVRSVKPGLSPTVFVYSESDVCSHQKAARFYLNIDETITKIISVRLRIRTAPLYNLFRLFLGGGPTLFGYFLPTQVSRYPILSIEQTEVTTSGTLFSVSGIGNRTDSVTQEWDITDYILNSTPVAPAEAGQYRFVAYDTVASLDGADLAAFTPSTISVWSPAPVDASGGIVYATFTVLAVTQAIR